MWWSILGAHKNEGDMILSPFIYWVSMYERYSHLSHLFEFFFAEDTVESGTSVFPQQSGCEWLVRALRNFFRPYKYPWPSNAWCEIRRDVGVVVSWRIERARVLWSKKSSGALAWTLNQSWCSRDKKTLALESIHSFSFLNMKKGSWEPGVWWCSNLTCTLPLKNLDGGLPCKKQLQSLCHRGVFKRGFPGVCLSYSPSVIKAMVLSRVTWPLIDLCFYLYMLWFDARGHSQHVSEKS